MNSNLSQLTFVDRNCFHKKAERENENLSMLTKVISLKALFEEEIRGDGGRFRGLESASHIYLYGWSIIYHFLLALVVEALNVARARSSRTLIGYFSTHFDGIYN